MNEAIKIQKAEGKWVVRAGGAVLAETTDALELNEGGMAPVIYFPRADIAMPFLEPSESRSNCPHKGEASYFAIETKSHTIADAAWSYESPVDGMEQIKDHIAFYQVDGKVTVERLF